MVCLTPFVSRRKYCVVDLLVLSMHELSYQVGNAENGMSISIGTEMSAFYSSSGRLENEIHLQGDGDTFLAAYYVVVDLIITCHGSHEVTSSNRQVIKLPFASDQEITTRMTWNEGYHLLYESFLVIWTFITVGIRCTPSSALCIMFKANTEAQNCKGGNESHFPKECMFLSRTRSAISKW